MKLLIVTVPFVRRTYPRGEAAAWRYPRSVGYAHHCLDVPIQLVAVMGSETVDPIGLLTIEVTGNGT